MGENLWFHFERIDPDQTSQESRIWTERSPKSRLQNINNELNSYSWDKANKLKTLIQNREYVKFQKEIWFTSKTDLDWKLWGNTFNQLKIYLSKIDQETNEIEINQEETKDELSNLWLSVITPEQITQRKTTSTTKNTIETNSSVEESQNEIDNLKINRAARRYLSKYESLSPSMYNLLFSWKEEIWQWQLWNCYMISWLIELTNTQYFDTLMKTSISRVRFKDDWSLWFTVKLPLWEPDGRDILIKDSEILMARVRWNIGYKLLELAYIKNKRPNNKKWNTYYPVSNEEIDATSGWNMTEVLQKFLWKNNIGFCNFWSIETDYKGLPLSSLSSKRKWEIINYLKNFNGTIWNSFTNLGTPMASGWDESTFIVWWNTLYNSHVYALSSVEKDSNWNVNYVYVKNPWNNKKKVWGSELKLSLNEFFNAFSYIWAWKIKVDTFLDDNWVSYA